MSELFKIKDTQYNLRKGNAFVSNKVKTTRYGLDSVSYLAPVIWDQIPVEIKKDKIIECLETRNKDADTNQLPMSTL